MSRDYTPVTDAELEALRISFTGGDVASTWIQRLIATVDRLADVANVFQSERPLAVYAATKPLQAEIESLSRENASLRYRVEHVEARASRFLSERNDADARYRVDFDAHVLRLGHATFTHALIEATLRNRIAALEAKLAKHEPLLELKPDPSAFEEITNRHQNTNFRHDWFKRS